MTLSRSDNSDADKPQLPNEMRERDHISRSHESVEHPSGSVEFSAQLESSVSLEAPRMRYVVVSDRIVSDPPTATSIEAEQLQTTPQSIPQPTPQAVESVPSLQTSDPTVIQLLAERVVVNRRQRKVGEVVVRKEIETHIVEVPVRREKLIVEQVSPEYEQLAVIDLGQPQVNELNSFADNVPSSPAVSGNFTSINEALQFLQAIAAESNSGLQQVQIRLVEDVPIKTTYQR